MKTKGMGMGFEEISFFLKKTKGMGFEEFFFSKTKGMGMGLKKYLSSTIEGYPQSCGFVESVLKHFLECVLFSSTCPVLGPPDTEYLSPQRQLVLVCPY